MNNLDNKTSHPRNFRIWKRVSIAALASTMILGGYTYPGPTSAQPLLISKKQDKENWRPALHCGRITKSNQLALQLDLLDKPETSYANVAYFIYARRNDQWVQVFTNTGARLITDRAGRVTLSPELFPIDQLQRRLGNVDLSNVDLKIAALVRYDLQGGKQLQTIQFERVVRYDTLVQTTTREIATYRSVNQVEVAQATTINYNPGSPFKPHPVTAVSTKKEKSRFSLAIAQKSSTLSEVIARVSLKARDSYSFQQERFLGDFRYKLKKNKPKAKFIKGVYTGDRVVVRLFTTDNQLIGYSEFELLSSSSAVTLVLPDQPLQYRIVRTIYGADLNQDFVIDRNVQTYDYFTQVTQTQSLRESRVTFLDTLKTVSLNIFDLPGFPAPRSNCVYPATFQSGSYTLVNQVIQVFNTNLAPVFVAPPSQLVQVINVDTTNTSVYEINQLTSTYQQVGGTGGSVVYTDDDDDDYDGKPGRRNCNQGIGNGAEGCDPGNSHPHGGSNDEGGRTPGHNNKPKR